MFLFFLLFSFRDRISQSGMKFFDRSFDLFIISHAIIITGKLHDFAPTFNWNREAFLIKTRESIGSMIQSTGIGNGSGEERMGLII